MFRHWLFQGMFVIGFVVMFVGKSFAFTPPPPEKCTLCHGLDNVYLEYKSGKCVDSSALKDGVGCFNCHIPGTMQMKQLGVSRREMGFNVLGYLYNAAKPGEKEAVWKAVRLGPREVCLRCHGKDEVRHCEAGNMKDKACHLCHMPVSGLITYRVHKEKPIFMHNDVSNKVVHGANNIEKYVTVEHHLHGWKADDASK